MVHEELVGDGEVDRAVAGDGEHAGQEGVEEGALGSLGLLHLLGTHVLEVDVLDAVDGGLQQTHDVAVTHVGVAGVEQEGDLGRVGQLHEADGLLLGLDDRAQVVVVDELQTVGVGDVAQPVEALGQHRPLLLGEHRLVGEDADVADALDRAGLLGDDDAGGAQVLQVGAGGLEVGDDGLDAVAQDEGGEPLGDDLDAAGLGGGLDLLLGREEAGALGARVAGVGQVQEHVLQGVEGADLGDVVIAPGDRVHAPGDAVGVGDGGCRVEGEGHRCSVFSLGW